MNQKYRTSHNDNLRGSTCSVVAAVLCRDIQFTPPQDIYIRIYSIYFASGKVNEVQCLFGTSGTYKTLPMGGR
jgi:hypothetical protein